VKTVSINHVNFIGVKFLLCPPDQSDDIIKVSLERQTRGDEGRYTEGFVGGSGAHLILLQGDASNGWENVENIKHVSVFLLPQPIKNKGRRIKGRENQIALVM